MLRPLAIRPLATRPLVAALAVLLLAPTARAQVDMVGPVEVCRLPVDAPAAQPAARRGAARLVPACAPAERTAQFDVTYTGFPPDAQRAFQAAVDVWACRVVSSQPIRVDAAWAPLDARTLGSAGPVLFRDFAGAPARGTFYPGALANAIAGRDLNRDQPDIAAQFNSDFPAWHLDPDAPPPPDAFDLATVVLHELAHGLGFIGALVVDGARGYVGEPGPERARGPYAYDLFTEAADQTALLDPEAFPDGSAALAAALRSTAVFFDGPAVRQTAGDRVRLFAPTAWADGVSYSHLDESTFAPGTPDGLMTPFLARGETVDEPGSTVCAVLADIGWTLAGDCTGRVGAVRTPAGVSAERTGPNPFSRETALRVTAALPGPVRAVLLDAAGRRVRVLLDRTLASGEAAVLAVSARDLASGVYFVHVTAGDAEALVPITVAR